MPSVPTELQTEPEDASARRAVLPVVCYPNQRLPQPDMALYRAARLQAQKVDEILVPARDARCFQVQAGQFFRIACTTGPQVGDLNLWNATNTEERFYAGKTRALHGTHLSTGDRMWSCFPYLRPMATIVKDTLAWYGTDSFGGAVHDVIGTRCDPYTQHLLSGGQHYHHCCHSNLSRAFAQMVGCDVLQAEQQVHDVFNVFMCTGFLRETGQYFMKASPVRPGDYIEFFAETNVIGALSACPGGDCSSTHSSDNAMCFPLLVEVFTPPPAALNGWKATLPNGYDRTHGLNKSGK